MALDVTTPHAFNIRAVQTNPVPVNTSPHTVILVPVPGGRGATGPAGDGASIFGETPVGAQNGVNTVFTTANPYRTGMIAVYLNGLREANFTEISSTQIGFSDPPFAPDAILIDYLIQ